MLRKLTCFSALVLFLASCASTLPTVASRVPCEAGSFTVVDDFIGSRRGSCAVLSDNHVRLFIRPEDKNVTNPSAWYAFKLIPHKATTATISLRYEDGYHRYVPKTSSDGLHWTPVDENSVSKTADGTAATLTIALADSPLWVSAQELITPSTYKLWSEGLATATDAELTVLGMSKMEQAVYVLTVNTDSKDVLLLTGRQHPPEVSGAFAFFSFYETLLADTDLAIRFRNRFQIIAVPLMNPDGVIGGNWRHNLGNTDLNRDWGPFKQPETRLIRDLLDRLDSEGKRIRVFLDFHSTAENVFYTQNEENITRPPGFTKTWLTNAEPRVSESYPFTNSENPTDAVGISKNYMYHRYGIPSSTYEVGDETARGAARQAAAIFAEELMLLMLEQEYD
jgi:predicted deacylase